MTVSFLNPVIESVVANEALTQLSSSKNLLKADLRHMGGSGLKLGGGVLMED